MKISTYSTNLNNNIPQKNKEQKIINQKTSSKQNENNTNPLQFQANYNIAFCGLFKKNKETSYETITQRMQMQPTKEYEVPEDTIFYLGNFKLNLESPDIKPTIDTLHPGESIIFGTQAFQVKGMNNHVSRKHLQISKNSNGSLIAKDLNSTNGTTIEKRIIKPILGKKSAFQLTPGKEYLIPKNSILLLGNTQISLDSYNFLTEQEITVGRGTNNDIQVNSPSVSRKHITVKGFNDNEIIIKDSGSSNGTFFIGVGTPVKNYEKYIAIARNNTTIDYSKITQETPLHPNARTIIPPDAQIRLGDDYIFDIRNGNIQKLLDKYKSITIGTSDFLCDIVVNTFYDNVAPKHLKLEKAKDGTIMATALNSEKNSSIIPNNKITAFPGGVQNIELSQENCGDCYLLAPIYAMSRNPIGANLLEKMIEINKQGYFIVSFKNQDKIIISPDELDGQSSMFDKKHSVNGDLSIKALERAYGKMIKENKSAKTLFADINGGKLGDAIEKMTGLQYKNYSIYNENIDQLLTNLKKDGLNNHILTCTTPEKGLYDNGKYMDEEKLFPSKHGYAIGDIDIENKEITIINPHNTKIKHVISWEKFENIFTLITDVPVYSQ